MSQEDEVSAADFHLLSQREDREEEDEGIREKE